MGKGSPPEGGSPGQEQAKGHRPGVETSGYGEHQGMVELDPRNAKGSGESHVSDSHVRAHVRQSKGPCHEAIPESSVIKKVCHLKGGYALRLGVLYTHRHSHINFWGRVQYENQVGNNVTFSTPTPMSAIVGSHDRSAYPIIRNNLSLGTPGRSVRNASRSSSI